MFRTAAPGPYDEAIAKATDENLTSEDWAAILEVCDRVMTDTNGAKEVVQSLIKRLAHRNANVQLYTLELANALSQNCEKTMHRELSSRAFTDALLKLANDRNTHTQVKAKILERMKEWADMFKADADLGIMNDAYYRVKQSNPTLQPPSAPQKNSLTELDRQKEENELQMALKLSLQEEERKKGGPPSLSVGAAGPLSSQGASQQAQSQQQQTQPMAPVSSGTTAATVSRVRALYDFVPSEPGELELKRGDVIAVLESVYKDWWRGSLKGKTGIFPLNYVEKLTDPTPDELQREAQMEAEVFAEIKNVEKLLTLLSTSNTAPREEDNEEISKLYHSTLAIRPKLIKLIEKYSQKKDDFTQLNEKFIKARRDYEALLESSMSHPPQPMYHQYAMRPQAPQGYPTPQSQPQSGYAPSHALPPTADPQRFYSPAPAQEAQPQYPASSQPHSFKRPGPGVSLAPFYMAGAEVPPQGDPLLRVQPLQLPHHPHPSQQQRAGQQRTQQVTSSSSGPPSAHGKPPAPPQMPSSLVSSASGAQHAAYQVAHKAAAPRPTSQYAPSNSKNNNTGGGGSRNPSGGGGGAPQELFTSAYDSPIMSLDSHPQPSYSSSAYSPEEPSGGGYETYATQSPVQLHEAGHAPPPNAPSAPPSAVPSAPTPDVAVGRPAYQPYRSSVSQQQQAQRQYSGDGYGH